MTQQQIIQRGFNHGYLLEKYIPKLAKGLIRGIQAKKHPYAIGFVEGGAQYVRERDADHKREELNALRSQTHEKPDRDYDLSK